MVANNHALDWARRGCILVWLSSSLNSISEQSYFSVGTPWTFSLQPLIACWLWRYLQPTSGLPSACADMQNSLSHVTVELFIRNPPHIRGLVGFSSSGFPLCLIAGIKAQPNRGSQSTPKFHLRASAGKREGGEETVYPVSSDMRDPVLKEGQNLVLPCALLEMVQRSFLETWSCST